MSNVISSITKGPEKPIFTAANCLNRRQKKFVCTVCHELCPGHVFTLDPHKELDWKQCTNCGMCVSLCPTRCFAPDRKLQHEYTEDLNLKEPVSFSCYSESELCTKTVECLAGVPWELLAFLALYTDVVLHVGSCAGCEHSGRTERIAENLEQLKLFLGEEKFTERVHVLTEGTFRRARVTETVEEPKEVSRREMFSDAGKGIAKSLYKAMVSRLPFLDDVEPDGLQYREMLSRLVSRRRENIRQAVKEKDPALDPERYMPRYGMMLPAYTTSCYGCGICEKICPHKAIEMGPAENGKRLIYITPWKCTGCTLCTRVCPYGGSAGLRPVQIPHLEKLALVRIDSASCENCHTAIKPGTPNGLCPSCAAKAGRRAR